jgi:hypothetical protein
VNWNFDIISPTTALGDPATWAVVATIAPVVIKPSNPVPPQQDFAVNVNKPTTRGWLQGRRPYAGLQYPRGVFNS